MKRAAMMLLFVTGVFTMALGIALSIRSNLGTTPISSLPVAMNAFDGRLSVGMATFALNVLFVVFQFLILRRGFPASRWLQVPAVLFFGCAINICLDATDGIDPSSYAARLAVNVAAIPVLALGVWECVKADVLLMPGDGLAGAISQALRIPFHVAKIATDTSIVVAAAVFALATMGRTVGIGEGTVLAMVLVGACVRAIDCVWTRLRSGPRHAADGAEGGFARRILYVSSTRKPWFESQDCAVHFANAPYSIDAIGFNLEKLGWTVGWAGWKSSLSPFRLARRIDEFRPDVVYTYGSTVALHPLFCRRFLCRHRRFRVVHGWDDHYGRIWGNMAGAPGKLLMDWMEKRIVKNSDAVATLSRVLQAQGRRWGVECEYIPNGADVPDESALSRSIRLEGRFRLVYSGDKAKWKRTKDVCEAMRRCPEDVKLYLTGKDEEYLKPYASRNCVFLGWLPRGEQLGVMSQADAFVSTSDQDCNAKLQEYLRWRKPILALDGEPNAFFENGRNALLAKDGDYAPLIMRLADDPELCRRLADNAAKDIPVHSWAEIAAMFDAYFRRVCGA